MAETIHLNQKHLEAIKAGSDAASLMDDLRQFFHQRRGDIEQSEAYKRAHVEFDLLYDILQAKLTDNPGLLSALESNVWEIAAACEDSAYQQGFKDGINFLMQVLQGGGGKLPSPSKGQMV